MKIIIFKLYYQMKLKKEKPANQQTIIVSKPNSRNHFTRRSRQIQWNKHMSSSRTFDSISPSKIESENSQKLPKSKQLICKRLCKILNKRKCFAFYKIARQFGSFSSQSSLLTVQGYNQILGGDQAAHTIYKIVETKLLQQKMWALYNLWFHKFLRRTQQAFNNVHIILQNKKLQLKKDAFKGIVFYSLKVQPIDDTNTASRYIFSSKQTYPRSSAFIPERQIHQVHHHHYIHHDQSRMPTNLCQHQVKIHSHCQLHCKNRETQFLSNKCNSCQGFLSQKLMRQTPQNQIYNLEQRVAYLTKLRQIAAQYSKSKNLTTKTSL